MLLLGLLFLCLMRRTTADAYKPSKNTSTSLVVQGQRVHFNISTTCTRPYFMVRSFGKYANMAHKGKDDEWRSHPPLSGEVILDITLIACNAFNASKRHCLLRNPVSIYRRNHTFVGAFSGINTPVLVQTAPLTTINTRYQNYSLCPKKHYTTKCTRSVMDAYSYIIPKDIKMVDNCCFVGASHAQRMRDAALRLGMKNARHIDMKFVSEMTLPHVVSNATRCEYAIIHTGQWDLGWPGKDYTPIEKFVGSLSEGFAAFKNASIPTLVVSNNYNPLAMRIISCPPSDWRRPDYIDQFNGAIRKAAARHGFRFVDNNALVVGVAWDSGRDWNHYDPKVNDAIVANILMALKR